MKEGVIKEIREYVKYDGLKEVRITKKEYDREMCKFIKEHEGEPSFPPVGINFYKVICLSAENVQGLVGVLSYDLALNLFALRHGYHPASGYKRCKSHEQNVLYREKQIALLGEEPQEITEGIFTKRNKTEIKPGFRLWVWVCKECDRSGTKRLTHSAALCGAKGHALRFHPNTIPEVKRVEEYEMR